MLDNTRLSGAAGSGAVGSGAADGAGPVTPVQEYFDRSSLGFAVFDDAGVVRHANAALCALLGRPAGAVTGTRLGELFTTTADLGADHLRVDARAVRAGGDEVEVVLDVAPVGGGLRAAVVVDVGEVVALRGALIRQSLSDLVTGLPNRVQFLRWLERCTGEVGLVHLDVDGFHVVNDALGHDAGDRLLKSVAGRLLDTCSARGRVARTGPDEFTVLVTDPTGAAELVGVVEELDASLAEPLYLGDTGVGVTVSAGVSVQRCAGRTAADLMRTAEVAARWSKQDGRARWTLYDPRRDADERRRFALAAAVAGALEDGEIDVRFAPVFSLPDHEVIALQASLHWERPGFEGFDQGWFPELSETTGSAARLGHEVLAGACAHASRWRAEFGDRTPPVAVRLSAGQCRRPELFAAVRDVLAGTGLPADRLWLVVADDVLLSLDADQVEELDILTSAGVSVLREQRGGGRFDAFGSTGVPTSGLKVDGSVVRGLDDTAEPVVRSAVVGMLSWAVRNLDSDLFADDVRTESEARGLAGLGVTAAQGPYFGDPLHPDDVSALLRRA
ncbi:diguanylate cyclase domain-containing protein [Actinosynnema sp. NPDC053489]|uniref:diguanylate cyclase domain-containing protein n=1 Tax=Actinosynnema sp. NPDC053489 TaxID=3363916 RepID=UPI0037C902A7